MGCGGSKNVGVRAATSGSSASLGDDNITDEQENQINVFDNNINNNNEFGGSCDNAKPRLRSAIRRSEIKPVTSGDNHIDISTRAYDCEIIKPSPLDFTDQFFVSELPFNRDSGFDSNRDHLDASERAKSSAREETSSVATSYTMRPDSNITGSVVTARDLNASFMTMSDDYTSQPHGDVSLDLEMALEDNLNDFEDSHCRTFSNTPSRTFSNTPSRTLSNTPSARPLSSTPSRLVYSTEPPLYPKSIDVIKEESEGGFTPRSLLEEVATPRIRIDPCKKECQKFYSDEVLRHNQSVGWSARGIYKGMVYDADKVITVFTDIHAEYNRKAIEQRKEERKSEINDDSFDDDDEYEDDCNNVTYFDNLYPKRFMNPSGSLARGIRIILDIGIPLHVIEQHLLQCVIGEVKPGYSSQHWEKFRKDINSLNEELIREDLSSELSENKKDVMEQLQRWIVKYRNNNPQPQPQRPGDPNMIEFDLPDGIRNNLGCLRHWLEIWERFDLEIPESGAWCVYEAEDVDLGDPQEIFEETLRSHVDLTNPFVTEVDGEAAWCVLKPGIVADDIMTDEQIKTERSRQCRTDLHDEGRMERRRVKLLNYFVTKYEMDERKASRFLQWSRAMEEAQLQLQLLCESR